MELIPKYKPCGKFTRRSGSPTPIQYFYLKCVIPTRITGYQSFGALRNRLTIAKSPTAEMMGVKLCTHSVYIPAGGSAQFGNKDIRRKCT